jgi:Zn-dependent protease with chaperone function
VNQFGFDGVADIAALPLFMLVMGAFGLLTMPLNNAFSRCRRQQGCRESRQSATRWKLPATDRPLPRR